MRYTTVLSTLIVALTAAPGAQSPAAGGAWIDATPIANWNTAGAPIPKPPAIDGVPLATGRCAAQVRTPANAGDHALVAAGWALVGPLQEFSGTTLTSAAVVADGMCRPTGYQIFVFREGRFAGTLSPAPMGARLDGMAFTVRLISHRDLSAEFARYAATDPLCCPSRVSTVSYRLEDTPGGPVVAAGSATTTAPNRK